MWSNEYIAVGLGLVIFGWIFDQLRWSYPSSSHLKFEQSGWVMLKIKLKFLSYVYKSDYSAQSQLTHVIEYMSPVI